MSRCAFPQYGAYGPGRHSRRGFTLLEICTVLCIIMLLLAVSMPAIQSAFVEQAVRNDAHQLSLMVKTAMLQSSEQNRPYVIELTDTTMDLHPFGQPPPDVVADTITNSTVDPNGSTPPPINPDVSLSDTLDSANKLLVPDPDKVDNWIAMPKTSWLFQPGELCPATRVRFTRGKGWLELSFNALTGNVENEAAYFP